MEFGGLAKDNVEVRCGFRVIVDGEEVGSAENLDLEMVGTPFLSGSE